MRKLMKSFICLMLLASIAVFTTGCRKPYDEAEYVEGKANETMFVVKLDGEQQSVKFDSAESLKKLQVAAKRIQVPHIFQQTGRWDHEG